MAQEQPKDVVEFLCCLHPCGKSRRTIVHGMHCTAVGTENLSACSTEEGTRAKRFAHDSLRSNHLPKLAVAYEQELGTATDWCDHLRVGIPVRNDLVTRVRGPNKKSEPECW